jgi:hypothetical protein
MPPPDGAQRRCPASLEPEDLVCRACPTPARRNGTWATPTGLLSNSGYTQPTGSGVRDTYLHGRGRIPMRGVAHIEEIQPGKGRHKRGAVVITELPYQLSKAGWIEKLAEQVNEGKLNAITVTSELAAPALQRGEPHAQQQYQLMGSGTVSDVLIQNLQSLLEINRRRQSYPSSPQKA